MVAALRPGGWLVLEDADPALQPLICPDEYGPAQQLANRLRRGFRTLLAQRGAELAFGRTLPRLLRQAGLAQQPGQGTAERQLRSALCQQRPEPSPQPVRQLLRRAVLVGACLLYTSDAADEEDSV